MLSRIFLITTQLIAGLFFMIKFYRKFVTKRTSDSIRAYIRVVISNWIV